MGDIVEFEKGTTVTIESTISDDTGQVVEPDNKNAFITIEDVSTAVEVVSKTTMENISDTQFKYDWQTTEGTSLGEYNIKVEADVSSDTYVNRNKLGITDVIHR